MDTKKSVVCKLCGETQTVEYDKKDFDKWKKGRAIQEALYYLSPSDREILMSGTCGKCFDKLFPPE